MTRKHRRRREQLGALQRPPCAGGAIHQRHMAGATGQTAHNLAPKMPLELRTLVVGLAAEIEQRTANGRRIGLVGGNGFTPRHEYRGAHDPRIFQKVFVVRKRED